jgi:hypothetical protein
MGIYKSLANKTNLASPFVEVKDKNKINYNRFLAREKGKQNSKVY